MAAYTVVDTYTDYTSAQQVRLERRGNLFLIVLERLQVYIQSGTCIPAGEDDEVGMYTGGDVWRTHIAKSWYEAREVFEAWKQAVAA